MAVNCLSPKAFCMALSRGSPRPKLSTSVPTTTRPTVTGPCASTIRNSASTGGWTVTPCCRTRMPPRRACATFLLISHGRAEAMKLLVTGGCGFIGSAVVRLAIARGHAVINLDALTYAACPDNVAEVAEDPGYAFEHADIRDRVALDRIFEAHTPDAVMHLAAESHVDR